MNLPDSVRANPPRTLAGLIGLAVPPITLWVSRWIEHLWANDPQMHAAMLALAIGVIALAAERAGKWMQQFTTPWRAKPPGDDLKPEWDRLGVPERDDIEPPGAEAGH